jgi:hypothetical protein
MFGYPIFDPLVLLSVFVPIPHYFYCYTSVVYFKLDIVMPPAFDMLFRRIALAIQGFLCFHMYFMIHFSISLQNVIGIFD